MTKEKHTEITIHLDDIHDLFKAPAADAFSKKASFHQLSVELWVKYSFLGYPVASGGFFPVRFVALLERGPQIEHIMNMEISVAEEQYPFSSSQAR